MLKSFAGGAAPTTLQVAIDEVNLNLVGVQFLGWPDGSGGPINVILGKDTLTEEKCLAAVITGTSLTLVSRGYDGTIARAHGAGTTIEHGWFGVDAQDSSKHVAASSGEHGLGVADGNFVGSAKAQVLTNKTISGLTNTLTDLPPSAIPTTTLEIVGLHNVDASLQTQVTAEVTSRTAGDGAVTGAFQSADAAHVAAVDPHGQYLTAAEGDLATTVAIAAHVALPDPHAVYLTSAEADVLFLTPAEETALKRVSSTVAATRIEHGQLIVNSVVVAVGGSQDCGVVNFPNGPFTATPHVVASITVVPGGTLSFVVRPVPLNPVGMKIMLFNVGSVPSAAGNSLHIDWIAVGI